MCKDLYRGLEFNRAKLERVRIQLAILEDPGFQICSNSWNRNRMTRKHRYLVRHVKRSLRRLEAVVKKQSLNK
jgi:hypothetical protein